MRPDSHTPPKQKKLRSSSTSRSTSTATTKEEPGEAVHKGITGEIREKDCATGARIRVSTEKKVECRGWFEIAGKIRAVSEKTVRKASGRDRQFHLR